MTREVLTLTALYLYPIKSAAPLRVERATLGPRGLIGDRRLMWVDRAGRFLSQREHPRLCLLKVALEGPPERGAALRVEGPGTARPLTLPLDPEGGEEIEVLVWGDRCAARVVEGGERWLKEALDLEGRLVYMPEGSDRPVDPRYARGGEQVSFADGFPLLLASERSLADLNARLRDRHEAPAPMERFRPNLVVDGEAPYAEDDWRELRRLDEGPGDPAGGPALRLFPVKPCSRCVMVNVDPETGESGKEPLATLATYRARDHKVYFAQNLLHEGEGILRVGDRLRIVESS